MQYLFVPVHFAHVSIHHAQLHTRLHSVGTRAVHDPEGVLAIWRAVPDPEEVEIWRPEY